MLNFVQRLSVDVITFFAFAKKAYSQCKLIALHRCNYLDLKTVQGADE